MIVSGVGAALYWFTLLAPVVIEGGLPKRFQRRRAARMLETINGHFILCGYGRMEFNPEPDTSIRSGDKLVALGRPDSLKHLEAEAAVGEAPAPVK